LASPTPIASGTPGPHPSGLESKALATTLEPPVLPKQTAAEHAHRPAAASETTGAAASRPAGNPNSVAPVEVAQVTQATDAPANPAPEPTQAPTAAPIAPAPATPAAPSQDSVPIYAPERIVDAQVRTAAQPDFPDADRERGEHGTSVVLVTIDPKGNVVSTAVSSSSGYPALDRAAVAAARESQFVAPKINGHPATETYRLVYDFTP
jgi:protein TonB